MAFYPGVNKERVSVGEREVSYYESEKRPSEQTIVLVHGTGGSAENNFWALFPMLAMRHRVVAMDLLDTDDPHSEGDGYAAQVRAVIESASPDHPVNLVGYSFGAVVAAVVAARNVESVATLTLVAGWLQTDAQQRLRNDVWLSLYETGSEALAPFTAFTTFSPRYLCGRMPDELVDLLDGIRNGPDREAKMRFNRDVDIATEVADISAPTLVIGCTQDQTVPIHHSHMLFGAISNARFARINAGHGVMTERPSEVFTMIDTFVRAPEAVAAGAVIANDHA